MREQRRLLYFEERERRLQERKQGDRDTTLVGGGGGGRGGGTASDRGARPARGGQPRFFQIRAGEEFRSFGDMAHTQKLKKWVPFLKLK